MSLRRLASIALGFNLAVILWGAYVRASGSGAGCGRHWPLCNGAAIPTAPAAATMIEYAHRVTSGLALILVGLLAWRIVRATRPGDRLRRAALASVVLIITEALVGAGLVLFELVGDDSSLLRAGYLAVHLTNTFALLAALTITRLWADSPEPTGPRRIEASAPILVALALILLVGITGAITALGDTLFPSGSLAEGLAQDQSPTAHALIRLRVIHPVLAVATAVFVCWAAARSFGEDRARAARGAARWVVGLALGQVAIGVVNLLLLVPIATQLLHLLGADLLWIATVGLLIAQREGEAPGAGRPAEGPVQ